MYQLQWKQRSVELKLVCKHEGSTRFINNLCIMRGMPVWSPTLISMIYKLIIKKTA